MFTPITAALVSGAACLFIGASLPRRLRFGGGGLTAPRNAAQVERMVDVMAQFFPTRQEMQQAFEYLAAVEQQRVQVAQSARASQAPQVVPQRPAPAASQDVNAVIAQQLAAMNRRMQQMGVQVNAAPEPPLGS